MGPLARQVAPGGSVAVDGACLTASGVSGREAEFDAVPETLGRTTLGELASGARVNLEPALTADRPLDGHIVQGHVDGLAEVARVDRGGPQGHVVRLVAETELTDQMVPKGSVAVAGVSLTVVEVTAGRFSVALVPTTLRSTTLGSLRVGDRLNLECDILGKYVRRYLQGLAGAGGGVTVEKLRQAGFI
jgi:riboflavin synthase